MCFAHAVWNFIIMCLYRLEAEAAKHPKSELNTVDVQSVPENACNDAIVSRNYTIDFFVIL